MLPFLLKKFMRGIIDHIGVYSILYIWWYIVLFADDIKMFSSSVEDCHHRVSTFIDCHRLQDGLHYVEEYVVYTKSHES